MFVVGVDPVDLAEDEVDAIRDERVPLPDDLVGACRSRTGMNR